VLAVKIRRNLRATPELWTPGHARTVSRAAIGVPRPAVAAAAQRALPAAQPALTQRQMQGLAELGGAILSVKAAPVAAERR
jgi:hypothetical protein